MSPLSGFSSRLAGGARYSVNRDEDEDGGKGGRQLTSRFDDEGESGRVGRAQRQTSIYDCGGFPRS